MQCGLSNLKPINYESEDEYNELALWGSIIW